MQLNSIVIRKENMKFPTIESSRIILKELDESDAPKLYEIYSNVEAMQYWDSLPHSNISETITAVENIKNAWHERQEITWGVFLKSSQQLIGKCSVHSWDKKHNIAQIGYIIDPRYWRNGFASEALKELIRYAFEKMKLKLIIAEIDPNNISSSAMLIKLGFVFSEKKQQNLMVNRVYYDTDVYLLTSSV